VADASYGFGVRLRGVRMKVQIEKDEIISQPLVLLKRDSLHLATSHVECFLEMFNISQYAKNSKGLSN